MVLIKQKMLFYHKASLSAVSNISLERNKAQCRHNRLRNSLSQLFCEKANSDKNLVLLINRHIIINSGQKDVEVFCVALVTNKLTII